MYTVLEGKAIGFSEKKTGLTPNENSKKLNIKQPGNKRNFFFNKHNKAITKIGKLGQR